ncbi:MAG: hypothetical protein NC238_07585, partial [Dehalobacter sp.]|nr:hypothetical protein [Dehalobacter sp.]
MSLDVQCTCVKGSTTPSPDKKDHQQTWSTINQIQPKNRVDTINRSIDPAIRNATLSVQPSPKTHSKQK